MEFYLCKQCLELVYSLLYASETYYNLKENELRSIERIEETYLRQLISTRRFCTISMLYLEFGVWPARFEIIRMRLLFLKYILNQDEKSTLYRFFKKQSQTKYKGDWVSMCVSDLSELEITLTFDEIKSIKLSKFIFILKEQILKTTLQYLKINIRKKREKKYLMSDFRCLNICCQINTSVLVIKS